MRRWAAPTTITVAAVALAGAAVLGIAIGSVNLPLVKVLRIILNAIQNGLNSTDPGALIILQLRLPRIVLAILVGAALATGGACYQAVLRNNLADPYIIGVSAGAGLGAALAMALGGRPGGTDIAVPGAAFAGALTATALVYRLATHNRRTNLDSLLLAGVAVSAFLTAAMSLVLLWRQQDMPKIVFWMMGGFSGRGWGHVRMVWPYIAVGLAGSAALAGRLNLMTLGEERAFTMGLPVERVKVITLMLGALLAAAAVSVSGIIGFVGLMIPHIVRLLVGPDHRSLIPASAIIGAAFLVAGDTLARVILSPIEVPIGILTALSGTPFFIWLLRKRGRDR